MKDLVVKLIPGDRQRAACKAEAHWRNGKGMPMEFRREMAMQTPEKRKAITEDGLSV